MYIFTDDAVSTVLHSKGKSLGFPAKCTWEEVLGPEVADAQAEDGELVQAGGHLLRERQKAGQPLQLPVQTVSVPFGGVRLGPLIWSLLNAGIEKDHKMMSKMM